MLRHAFGRAVAALTTIGSVSTLALVAVAAPASAASICSNPGYPAPVATSTSLSLTRTVGQYGAVNVASVRVSSGAGTPTGTVRITVSNGASYQASLDRSGFAQRQLPRGLTAQHTYKVSARYDGQGSCRPSGPVSKYYTVVKAGTDVRGLVARDIRKGGRPSVAGRVTSYTGVTPSGSVLVKLVKNGHVEKSKTVTLRDGRFRATFGRTSDTGGWTVKAAYLGNRNFKDSSDSTTFQVTRR